MQSESGKCWVCWKNATSVTFGANGRSEQKQDWDSIVEGSFYLGDKVRFFGQNKIKRVGIQKIQISDKFQESKNLVLFLFFAL